MAKIISDKNTLIQAVWDGMQGTREQALLVCDYINNNADIPSYGHDWSEFLDGFDYWEIFNKEQERIDMLNADVGDHDYSMNF